MRGDAPRLVVVVVGMMLVCIGFRDMARAAETTTESVAAVENAGLTVPPELLRNPDPFATDVPVQTPAPGTVRPTAAGNKGGATTYTASMPLDLAGLVELRKPLLGRPEMRGAWVTRYEWIVKKGGRLDKKATMERIRTLMAAAAQMRLNAVFFQVRADATTMYPSELEPWSQMLGGKDPGFDPLRFALDEAHKNGLEFHAYINPMPCTEERTTRPASLNHIWYKHCMPKSRPNWLVHQGGKPAPRAGYAYLNANLPGVRTHLRHVALDLVKRYDVDGIHFDRIRFPSSKVSDDAPSKRLFKGPGNPDGIKSYNVWQAQNITRMLTDIYGSIMEIKPRVKVSAAVWGIYDKTKLPQGRDKNTGYSWTSSGLQDYMQDSIAWTKAGCMDALVPMIYWDMGGAKPDYDELLLSFVSSVGNGRHVYGGQKVFGGEEMLREVVATNLIGGQGTVPFTLSQIARGALKSFYRETIYPSPAPVPEMPWKTNPRTGIVLVQVRNKAGKPVSLARVSVDGVDYTGLTDADGFCSVLGVPPGGVAVQVKAGKRRPVTSHTQVEAGKAARVEFTVEPGKRQNRATEHAP